MEKHLKKNYCLSIYGGISEDLDAITDLIKSFTTEKPVIYGAPAMLISAFSTYLELDELDFFLREEGYSFMIFEMDTRTSRAHTEYEAVQKKIFDEFFDNNEGDFVEFEDIDSSKLRTTEVYLKDLLADLEVSITNDDFENAVKIRDEIKDLDEVFYEKYVKNNDFLE
jgi:hypothetical protein